jgi:hypothetical protein
MEAVLINRHMVHTLLPHGKSSAFSGRVSFFPDYPESTFICELFEMLFNYYSSNFN